MPPPGTIVVRTHATRLGMSRVDYRDTWMCDYPGWQVTALHFPWIRECKIHSEVTEEHLEKYLLDCFYRVCQSFRTKVFRQMLFRKNAISDKCYFGQMLFRRKATHPISLPNFSPCLSLISTNSEHAMTLGQNKQTEIGQWLNSRCRWYAFV